MELRIRPLYTVRKTVIGILTEASGRIEPKRHRDTEKAMTVTGPCVYFCFSCILCVSVSLWFNSSTGRIEPQRHRDTEKAKPSQDYAFDAVLQYRDAEVDQQAHPHFRKAEICEELGFVDRQKFLNSFQLDDQLPRKEQVHAEINVQVQTFIDDWERLLGLVVDATQSQLVLHAELVDTLEQSRA
jgi:hypothetical protein